MKYYNEENSLVIKSWCEEPEEGAINQAKNLAKLPFAFRQICLMPDTHQGYGMPIGGVMATQGVVVPNAVGVDIGCGMCAVKTSLTEIDVDTLKKILGEIRKQIPVGFSHQPCAQDDRLMPSICIESEEYQIINEEYLSARKQLGTLGGGNHFIEIQKGNDKHIWIMIHSGSRNLGKKVADHYNKKAVEINERYFSQVPQSWELAFLPLDSEEGQAYLAEMQYCVDFALANRKLMMDRIKSIFTDVLLDDGIDLPEDIDLCEPMINIAHNYARMENHFGKNVLVHRKGATSARKGEIGIIPGSQGTASYIVKGLGNTESFMSCSHGAGRKMGRKEAQRTLVLEDEQKKLDDLGILHAIRGKDDLDDKAILPLEFVFLDGSAKWETRTGKVIDSKVSNQTNATHALYTALNTEYATELLLAAVNHWRQWNRPSARLLVVAANIKAAKGFTETLIRMGLNTRIATSDDSADAQDAIKAYKTGKLEVLVSVGMCYEGLDVPAISHIACLTNIRSLPWIEQMAARAVRIDSQAGHYESQKAFVFAPKDPMFLELKAQIDAEQNAAAKETGVRVTRDGSNGELFPGIAMAPGGIKPLSSKILGVDLPTLPPVIFTPSEKEDDLRDKIDDHIKAFCRQNRFNPKRINAEVLRAMGKKRQDMTIKELERCLAHVEQKYPLTFIRGTVRRVPIKAVPLPCTWR